MKKLLFIIAVLLSFGAKSQTFTPVHNYQAPDGLAIQKYVGIPHGDTATYIFPDSILISGIKTKTPAILFQNSDSTVYVHWGKWIAMKGTGGGTANLDSVVYRTVGFPDSTGYWGINNKGDTILTAYFEGGGGSGGSGIQSVTGDIVDNTDPLNPVVNAITQSQLDDSTAAVRGDFPGTPSLQDVVTVGNTTSQDIFVNGLTIGKGAGNRSSNTAFGVEAQYTNTIWGGNTAIGYQALKLNTDANNTAIGSNALSNNTTGTGNTAIGDIPLINNTTGEYNIAIGVSPLNVNTTGSYNIAIGNNSLLWNNGGYNTAIGSGTLSSNAAGGAAITTGTGNTAIGYSAALNGADYINTTSLGANSQPTSSNQVVLGDTSVTQVLTYGNVLSKVAVKSTDPTTTDIPDGFTSVYKNSTDGKVYLWANVGGTLLKVQLQ